MNAFFIYLYSSLSGRAIQFQYIIDNATWDATVSAFRNYALLLTTDDDLFISVSEDEICMQEFYNSGIYFKGVPMSVNNEICAILKNDEAGINVTIELYRAAGSRIMTNILIIFSLVAGLLTMLQLGLWFINPVEMDVLPQLIFISITVLILIIMWALCRMKYLQMKKGIKTIIFAA